MKSGMGFSSNVELNFTTEQVRGDKVLIECTAENSERMVIERLEVKIKSKLSDSNWYKCFTNTKSCSWNYVLSDHVSKTKIWIFDTVQSVHLGGPLTSINDSLLIINVF